MNSGADRASSFWLVKLWFASTSSFLVQLTGVCVVLDIRGVAQLIDFRAVFDACFSLQSLERLLVVGELGLAEASVDRNWGPLSSHFRIGISF